MKITVENCNNIRTCNLEVINKKVNLVYGLNGSGKSTIMNSICAKLNNVDLTRFKSFSCEITENPKVSFSENITSFRMFDQHFLNSIVFSENKLLSSDISYELFVFDSKTVAETVKMKSIFEDFLSIINDDKINRFVDSINSIQKLFKGNSNTLSKNFAGLSKRNPMTTILQSPIIENVKINIGDKKEWVGWWRSGYKHMVISPDKIDICPFCGSELGKNHVVQIDQVADILDQDAVMARENLEKILEVIDETTNLYTKPLDVFLKGSGVLDTSKKTNAENLRKLIEKSVYIKDTISNYKQLSNFDFLGDSDFFDIDINILKPLKAYPRLEIAYNGILEIRNEIEHSIQSGRKQIYDALKNKIGLLNEFCSHSGIDYIFETSQTRKRVIELKHKNSLETLPEPGRHLSYGEANALSCLIFALISSFQSDELVLIDDPFSSFDDEKRKVIFQYLFGTNGLLNEKTVLYCTHDMNPVFEFLKLNVSDQCVAHYLVNNEGEISVRSITKQDFIRFEKYLFREIEINSNQIVKSILIRRYLEVVRSSIDSTEINDLKLAYNYLSSITKGCPPRIKRTKNFTRMSLKEIEIARNYIIKKFPSYSGFDWKESLEKTCHDYFSTNCKTTKLILTRYIVNHDKNNGKKHSPERLRYISYFVDSVHHIENETFLTLNPILFDRIPNFVIKNTDLIVKEYFSVYHVNP